MKTYILIALCFFTFSSISAQSNALGIRLGGGDGSQAEISYQQYIGGPNRLEFDLAFFDDGYADGFKFTLLSVSYTHLRAHETVLDLVCRLLLEKKKLYKSNTDIPLNATDI